MEATGTVGNRIVGAFAKRAAFPMQSTAMRLEECLGALKAVEDAVDAAGDSEDAVLEALAIVKKVLC